MTYAKKLKQHRKKLGLTQAGLASLLGVSKSVVEKWEAGARTPLELTQEGVFARMKKQENTQNQ